MKVVQLHELTQNSFQALHRKHRKQVSFCLVDLESILNYNHNPMKAQGLP